MITRGSAERVREEHLNDSSKRLKLAVGGRRSFHTMRTRYASSTKRPRDDELVTSSQRSRYAVHADCEEARTLALSSDKKAQGGAKSAARVRKRPCSQSQAAGSSRAVSDKATSTSEQVSANCFLLVGFLQSMHTSIPLLCTSKSAAGF